MLFSFVLQGKLLDVCTNRFGFLRAISSALINFFLSTASAKVVGSAGPAFVPLSLPNSPGQRNGFGLLGLPGKAGGFEVEKSFLYSLSKDILSLSAVCKFLYLKLMGR